MTDTYITVWNERDKTYAVARLWAEDLQSQVTCTCDTYQDAIKIRDALIAREENDGKR